MKAILFVLLFLAPALAQNQSALAAVESACGPAEVYFDTQRAAKQSSSPTAASKSTVYVVEVFDKVVGELARSTLRVGVDGAWMGADKGNSYIFFSVDPGVHHLCTNWQSRWRRFSNQAAFTSFTSEPGETYYFRARITEHGGSTGASNFSLDLEPVNSDEGKYLVAASAFSVSHPKK